MSIPEEIEQLKIKLDQTADENEQAEVLMEMLRKTASIKSIASIEYIDRLLFLADRLHSIRYKAWGIFQLGTVRLLQSQNDKSLALSLEALELFGEVRDMEGVASAYNNIGNIYYFDGNHTEALKNYNLALQIRSEQGDLKGQASSYFNIGLVYKNQGAYPEALQNNLNALSIRREIQDLTGISGSLSTIGNILEQQGNYIEALKNYTESLRIREETGNKWGIGNSCSNIGVAHFYLGNYPEALKYFLASLAIAREVGDKAGMSNGYCYVALLNERQNDYTEAIKNHYRALELRKETGEKIRIAESYENIGTCEYKLNGPAPALENFMLALDLRASINDKRGMIVIYNRLGGFYETEKNLPLAIENYKRAQEIAIEIGDKKGIADANCGIGEALLKQGDHQAAIRHQLTSLEIARKIGHKDLIRESSMHLSNIYKTIKEYEKALIYYEKFHEVLSEILGEDSNKQLTNLSFMHNLEQKEKDLEIEHLRNVELKAEKDRSEALLLNILPAEVAEELKEKGTANAKHFDEVTVLFTDFKGFTTVSERLTAQQLVDELHACFSAFDEITHRYGIEKIKTVGDAYLAVAGLPLANEDHAQAMVKAAQEIRDFMLARKQELGEMTFEIRIGVHSGSVVAGIVGVKKFAYDIWGDTVNTAARMEQNSEAGKINISESTYQLVKDHFSCEYRGEIEAKNKGKLKMYFVN